MLRKANLGDVKDIHSLISPFAEQNLMLPRSVNEIYEHIRDFVVFVKDGEIFGCCALQIYIDELAEIKSLAVKKGYQNKGIGRKLVEFNLQEAVKLKAKKIFVLTYEPEFFAKFGFNRIDKDSLPQKIWRECVKCPKFPDCDEVALIKELAHSS